MTAKTKKRQRPTSLSHGRPPITQKPKSSLSAKATRTLIRSHHRLHKALAEATRTGDGETATAIRQQIEEKGGLKSYQQASIQGQSSDRGGDTSKLLMEWLPSNLADGEHKLRMLEVGALSVSNACSKSGMFQVTCIDLNSQAPGIEQQDFMERPLPSSDDDRFDIISLSLVLNYVPDAIGRGNMLRRTCQFLRGVPATNSDGVQSEHLPSLFLVLPAPCINNSRYLDEKLMAQIMMSLNYKMIERKVSSKLIYFLWRFDKDCRSKKARFAKYEVNPGKTRNNFAIVLEWRYESEIFKRSVKYGR
ncbi:hypothetical protein MBLNU459_g5348t1 [Dothideomycetes sp. NU459]